jgi:hypothetical protein
MSATTTSTLTTTTLVGTMKGVAVSEKQCPMCWGEGLHDSGAQDRIHELEGQLHMLTARASATGKQCDPSTFKEPHLLCPGKSLQSAPKSRTPTVASSSEEHCPLLFPFHPHLLTINQLTSAPGSNKTHRIRRRTSTPTLPISSPKLLNTTQ